jgi:ATP-dependent Clp protease ATP-binding subunit ClpC
VGLRPDLDDLDQEIARVRRDKEAAIDRQDFEAAAPLRDQEKQLLAARAGREKEWAQAAAGRMPLAQELGQMKAELERLQASLREHGIEPGDDAA